MRFPKKSTQTNKRLQYKYCRFFLGLISFNTPQAIVINIFLILIILFFLPYSKLGYIPVHSLYGSVIIPAVFEQCPDSGIFKNCGFYSVGETRAVSLILHLRFKEAYEMNFLAFPLLIAMVSVLIFNMVKIIMEKSHPVNHKKEKFN